MKRHLARFCLALLLWPQLAAAAENAVPVVTNISGGVAVQGVSGGRRDVISSQIVHTGDVVITGLNSLAIVALADVARVRLGPATTATTFSTGSDLSLHLHSGLLCVNSDAAGTKIDAGPVGVSSTHKGTIFNLLRNTAGTNIAVYQGQVKASINGRDVDTLNAGRAVHIWNGSVTNVALANAQRQFASLRCPDQSIVAQAEALEPKNPAVVVAATQPPLNPDSGQANGGSTAGSGGGGGILGILLGIVGLAALAAGHGGGGAGAGAGPTPPPGSPGPSPQPSVSPTPGVLNVSPGSLIFTDVGSSSAQPFNINETNFFGNFNVDASNCSGIATISAPPFSGPSATVSVTPQNSGTCTIVVSDGQGGTANVGITVGPFGPLTLNNNAITLTALGNTDTFTVSESIYTGAFNVVSSNVSVASVSPASRPGPGPESFTVRAEGVGNANIVVTDDHGGQQNVLASVVTGGLSLSAATLQFSGPGDVPQDFVAVDAPPVGFLATSSDPSVAVVVQIQANFRKATFRVTPVGNGKAAITVSDTDGGLGVVNVGVGTSPLLLKHHSVTLLLPRPRPSAPAPRPGAAPSTRPVLPAVAGPQNGLHGVPSSTSNTGTILPLRREPLFVGASSLSLAAGSPAQQIIVSEKDYTGAFTVVTSNAAVATIDEPGALGPTHAFRVTPRNPGVAVIRIADDHGNAQLIQVIIAPSERIPRIVRPNPRI